MGSEGYEIRQCEPENIMSSGHRQYWSPDFANIIREVDNKVGAAIFPTATYSKSEGSVTFSIGDFARSGNLRDSCSLKEKAIPDRCLKMLQKAIDLLHSWAEEPGVPKDKQDFCRGFRLPDPRKSPEAYRMTGGAFTRQLHVLWGYQKDSSEPFLPKSSRSEKWDDNSQRMDIVVACQGSWLRRLFRPRNILLAAIASALAYFGFFMPVRCPVHHDQIVGKGIWRVFTAEDQCPLRCVRPGCNKHLDENMKCNAHKCRRCGLEKPLHNEESGLCEDCFWHVD